MGMAKLISEMVKGGTQKSVNIENLQREREEQEQKKEKERQPQECSLTGQATQTTFTQ